MADILEVLKRRQRSVAEDTELRVKLSLLQDAIAALEETRDENIALLGQIGDVIGDIDRGALVELGKIRTRLASITCFDEDWRDPDDEDDLVPGVIPLDTPLDGELGKLQALAPSKEDGR